MRHKSGFASWVGAMDSDIRDIHGYQSRDGTTYNAYFVKANSKSVLIDTVKASFLPHLLGRLKTCTKTLDYVIMNHGEPDHSGSLPGPSTHSFCSLLYSPLPPSPFFFSFFFVHGVSSASSTTNSHASHITSQLSCVL